MTQAEKNLLLKDLCARLPYGVKIQFYYEEMSGSGYSDEEVWVIDNDEPFHVNDRWLENVKPYLRPMSSMTEEEENEWLGLNINPLLDAVGEPHTRVEDLMLRAKAQRDPIDWLNKHQFDHRGLIPMGLALKAPEDMY